MSSLSPQSSLSGFLTPLRAIEHSLKYKSEEKHPVRSLSSPRQSHQSPPQPAHHSVFICRLVFFLCILCPPIIPKCIFNLIFSYWYDLHLLTVNTRTEQSQNTMQTCITAASQKALGILLTFYWVLMSTIILDSIDYVTSK